MGNTSSSSSSSSSYEEAEEPDIELPPPQQPSTTTTTQTMAASAPNPPSSKVDSNTSSTPVIDNPYPKTNRFTAWICFLASNIIAVTSILEGLGNGFGPAVWVTLVAIISICCSVMTIVFYCCFKRKYYVDRRCGEGSTAFLLLILWIGALGVAMSPTRQLAVTRTDAGLNVVLNANLYFSSWIAFAAIFYIFGSWLMAHWQKAAETIKEISARLAKWWGLFVVSIIVVVSAAQFHVSQNCPEGGKTDLSLEACKANEFAVALGTWGTVLTLVAIVLSHLNLVGIHILFYVELACAIVLIGLYTAGVGLITYNEGSGIVIGNLYFSTWIGFAITIFLNIDLYHELMRRRALRKANKRSSRRSKRKSRQSEQQQQAPPAAAAAQPVAVPPQPVAPPPPPPPQPSQTQTVYVSAPQPVQTQAQPRAAPQPTTQMPPAPALMKRTSSLGLDEFDDARDDLELGM